MELPSDICAEWRDEHRLSRRSLAWIREHADPVDESPIVHGIDELRRLDRDRNV